MSVHNKRQSSTTSASRPQQCIQPTVLPISGRPSSDFLEVTPELAELWLEQNPRNRVIRWSKVDQYARLMLAGQWTYSNDDICISVDLELLNGQHRSLAVQKSGVTCTMGVKFGMPAESVRAMDVGIGRTPADLLRWQGEENSRSLAAALKLLWLVKSSRISGDTRAQVPTNSDFQQTLIDHPDIRESVVYVSKVRADIACSPSVLAVCHYLIAEADGQDSADLYLSALATMINEPPGSPVLAVVRRLGRIRSGKIKVEPRSLLLLMVRGWNAYARGQKVERVFTHHKTEKFALPYIMQSLGTMESTA